MILSGGRMQTMPEQVDISQMRSTGIVHVEDPNALDAFQKGILIFDVTEHGKKLEAFALKHRLKMRMGKNGFPSANLLVNDRPVYFGLKDSQ
jgi:hypothetical protein